MDKLRKSSKTTFEFLSSFLTVLKTATVFPMDPLHPDFSSPLFHKSNLRPVVLFNAFLSKAEALIYPFSLLSVFQKVQQF